MVLLGRDISYQNQEMSWDSTLSTVLMSWCREPKILSHHLYKSKTTVGTYFGTSHDFNIKKIWPFKDHGF